MKITINRNYQKLKEKFGPATLNDYGEHVWPGIKFVKDASSGAIIKRTREVKYLGRDGEGRHFYLGEKSILKEGQRGKPSFD